MFETDHSNSRKKSATPMIRSSHNNERKCLWMFYFLLTLNGDLPEWMMGKYYQWRVAVAEN